MYGRFVNSVTSEGRDLRGEFAGKRWLTVCAFSGSIGALGWVITAILINQ